MRIILFFLFVAVPFAELALLIHLGQQMGFWPTMGLIVATALVGTFVLQSQGIQTMRRIARAMAAGEPPVGPVVDGLFLAIAGAFLLTPGVITDGIGLLLLLPPVRWALVKWGFRRVLANADFTMHTHRTDRDPQRPHGQAHRPGKGPVIDGEFEHVKNPSPENSNTSSPNQSGSGMPKVPRGK